MRNKNSKSLYNSEKNLRDNNDINDENNINNINTNEDNIEKIDEESIHSNHSYIKRDSFIHKSYENNVDQSLENHDFEDNKENNNIDNKDNIPKDDLIIERIRNLTLKEKEKVSKIIDIVKN